MDSERLKNPLTEFTHVRSGFELIPVSRQLSFFTAPLRHAVLCTTLHCTRCRPYSVNDLVQAIFLLICKPKTLNSLHDLCASSSPLSFRKHLIFLAFLDFLHLWTPAALVISTALVLTFTLVVCFIFLYVPVFFPQLHCRYLKSRHSVLHHIPSLLPQRICRFSEQQWICKTCLWTGCHP